jgi:mycothiol system anti-sigma-R factor
VSEHDCDEALAELYRYLDQEMDAENVARIEAHLQDCAPCLGSFDFEKELRRAIQTGCREKVSAELRARVLVAIEMDPGTEPPEPD